MEKIICPECGVETTGAKFCTVCGAFLNRTSVKNSGQPVEQSEPVKTNTANLLDSVDFGGKIVDFQAPKQENTSVSDKGLEFLINTCRKTMATVGGDGYSEYVLYKRDKDIYELHYYSKYEYMESEVHLAYKSNRSIVEEAFKHIEELQVEKYQNQTGIGMEGGQRILKYKKEGQEKMIRITSDNLPMDKQNILSEIERIITRTAKEEYKLL